MLCNFNGFGVKRQVKFGFYEAVTGARLSPEDWCSLNARRILNLQRAMLLLGGPDVTWSPAIHDDSPPRFYDPLPTGPYKGKASKRKEVEEARQQYYAEAGWDEKGIPRSEELRKLGLQDVDKALKKLRG